MRTSVVNQKAQAHGAVEGASVALPTPPSDPAGPTGLRGKASLPQRTDEGFRGRFAFCSNFHERPVTYQGLTFRCAEGAFQAAKYTDPEFRASFCDLKGPAAKAKGRTRHPSFRKDWDVVRVPVMAEVQEAKYSDPELRAALLATEGIELVEVNTWHDTFWGVCGGRGENNLGKIQMRLRDRLVRS